MELPATLTEFSGFQPTGGQQGSQPGGWFRSPSGVEYYIKRARSPEHAWNELAMMRTYEWAGGQVGRDIPEVKLVASPADGSAFIVSRKIEGLSSHPAAWWREHPDAASQAQRFWAVDVLLSHWDVVGLAMDNLLVDSHMRPVRIETGGAGSFRAQGASKPSFEVGYPWDEPWSMRGKQHGSAPASDQVAGVFDTIPGERAAELLHGLETLDTGALSALLAASGVPNGAAERLVAVIKSRIQQIPAIATELAKPSEPTVKMSTQPRILAGKDSAVARLLAPFRKPVRTTSAPPALPGGGDLALDSGASLSTGADPFCARNTPSPLLETERFILIPDAYPICRGHLLVVPKEHLGTFSEADPSVLAERGALTKLGVNFLADSFGGSVIAWENGGYDQSVPHAHRHLWSSSLESLPPIPTGSPEVVQLKSDHEIKNAAKQWGCYFDVELNGDHRAYLPGGAEARALKTGYVRPSRAPARENSVSEIHRLWDTWAVSHQATLQQTIRECTALAASRNGPRERPAFELG